MDKIGQVMKVQSCSPNACKNDYNLEDQYLTHCDVEFKLLNLKDINYIKLLCPQNYRAQTKCQTSGKCLAKMVEMSSKEKLWCLVIIMSVHSPYNVPKIIQNYV